MRMHSLLWSVFLAGLMSYGGHTSTPVDPKRAAGAAIVEVDPHILASISSEAVESDAHMRIVAGQGARVADKVVYQSSDARLQLDVSRYDEFTSNLTDWPVDELMYFLEGRVEISDHTGHSHIYGPGDTLVMPKGFNGTWKQLSPIKKIALSYDSLAANPQTPSAAQASPRITSISATDLEGSESKMEPIEGWVPYLDIVGQTHGKYVEIQRFKSADERLALHVKRFERCTLRLKDWPVDEFMHFVRGHLDISDGVGAVHRYGPGDTILIPKGFSGTWRQENTIDMITAAYEGGMQ